MKVRMYAEFKCSECARSMYHNVDHDTLSCACMPEKAFRYPIMNYELLEINDSSLGAKGEGSS